MSSKYDAIVMIAYGGPEKTEDIRPFLSKVSSGRPIPPERLEEVAHHYELIGGKSPLSEITFRQAKALEARLKLNGYSLPVYVGMRNWHPFLSDTIIKMSKEGVKKALVIIMAAHQSDASWERYQRDVEEAISTTGVELSVDYTEPFYDHPLFIEDSAERIAECFEQIPSTDRDVTLLIFTAHSIPTPMADASPYIEQLTTSCRLISERLGHENWMLAYQSRSGRPKDPWLEPDVCDVIRELSKESTSYVIIQPIGFICDHVEVLYDIGIEASEVAEEVGIKMLRAKTVNDDQKFIEALADIVKNHINKLQDA
jgi:ferrochelatase